MRRKFSLRQTRVGIPDLVLGLPGAFFGAVYVNVDLAGKVGTLNLSDEVFMKAVPTRG